MVACKTCGGWVPPAERLHTDEGLFHDSVRCLTEQDFEALISKWGCEGGCQEWAEHLEEEHREDAETRAYWSTEELAARERRFMDARLP